MENKSKNSDSRNGSVLLRVSIVATAVPLIFFALGWVLLALQLLENPAWGLILWLGLIFVAIPIGGFGLFSIIGVFVGRAVQKRNKSFWLAYWLILGIPAVAVAVALFLTKLIRFVGD
jgi:hypothetical protein|tara:strand:+ start:267 stop:620 length:354 start_codon:yes stop_codon:yes gene_type:complete